jgi:hypothetical protein
MAMHFDVTLHERRYVDMTEAERKSDHPVIYNMRRHVED